MSPDKSLDALSSPNPLYTRDVDPDIIRVTGDRIDDVVELSTTNSSAVCTSESLSHWCEVEMLHSPDPYYLRTTESLCKQRLLLRHDVVFDGEVAGDIYHVIMDDVLLTQSAETSLGRTATILSIPKYTDEQPIALHSRLKDPCLDLRAIDTPTEASEIDTFDYNSLALGSMFSAIINTAFYDMRRMTEYDVEILFNELSLIYDALSYGQTFNEQ